MLAKWDQCDYTTRLLIVMTKMDVVTSIVTFDSLGIRTSSLPIVLLTQSDGSTLLKQCLDWHGKNVLASLDAESADADQPHGASSQTQAKKSPSASKKKTDNGGSFPGRSSIYIISIPFGRKMLNILVQY